MMDLILLLQADLDIQAAFSKHEEFQPGRGYLFMQQLDVALGLMRQFPEIGPVYQSPYRRMLIHDFPYGIFYQTQSSRIVVVSVMDLRQHSETIRQKLSLP
jgi:plasmid stabilization system protein ParE